ncbi:hypothetical protein EK21DRAFT_94550 [Setomelanomma holmii]|uniref:Uncharacterized protein n=1 Tax=Setomelanomma holmii TaxID=210430 RepID=A0A9P4GW89_9PLEO|nr:hypothetical protein EK21DRAFT_94550 [Setomelanomma holmii]
MCGWVPCVQRYLELWLQRRYHALGADLGCGCSPNNACWCGTCLPATSHISSCVSAACSKFGNFETDVKSMLDMYGRYCATANVEFSTTPAATTAVTTAPAQAPSARAATKSLGVSSPTAAAGLNRR